MTCSFARKSFRDERNALRQFSFYMRKAKAPSRIHKHVDNIKLNYRTNLPRTAVPLYLKSVFMSGSRREEIWEQSLALQSHMINGHRPLHSSKDYMKRVILMDWL